MIGGYDEVLEGQPSRDELDILLGYVERLWPAAVCHGDVDADLVRLKDASSIVTSEVEFFIYQDKTAYDSWERDEGVDKNQAIMIHVIVTDEDLTVVVDQAGSEPANLVTMAFDAIRRGRLLAKYER